MTLSTPEWVERYAALYQLFKPSILTGLATGLAGSVLGVFVLMRREALVALALPQVVAAGAAFGMRFLEPLAVPAALGAITTHVGWPTLPPAVAFVGVALLALALSRNHGTPLLLPCLYLAGLCLSFIFVASAGQHLADIQKLFTGIDVSTEEHVAEFSAPVLLVCGAAAALLWRRWLLIAQAPETAALAGVRPAAWDALFLLLLAVEVLLGTNAVSVVMVLVMLFMPAAAVLPWVRRVPSALLASAVLSQLLYVSGFVLSNEMDWPLSHSVGAAGFAVLTISHLLRRVRRALTSYNRSL
jgi:zinc/manganese transport system permease protein